MQYVEDWKGILQKFAEYNPSYILLADLPAGKIPTYATVQNHYEAKIPYWFFNVDEVIETMSIEDYKLILKTKCIDKRLGIEQSLLQDNFPKEYRVGDTCNLLFVRKEI
jgi:putative methyltransferase (TIGR04325 family)